MLKIACKSRVACYCANGSFCFCSDQSMFNKTSISLSCCDLLSFMRTIKSTLNICTLQLYVTVKENYGPNFNSYTYAFHAKLNFLYEKDVCIIFYAMLT